MSNKKQSISNASRVAATLSGLAVVAFVAANVGMVTAPLNGGGQSQAAVAAKGGNGGGVSTVVTLPATWPVSVPVPSAPATLTGTNSSIVGSWTAQYRFDTGYAQAMQTVDTLYLGSGFTKTGDTAVYSNDMYIVTAVGTNVDHNATRTDVVIYVTTK